MIRRIIKAIRRARAVAYVKTLQKQLGRLELELHDATEAERPELARRVRAKQNAIGAARQRLASLVLLLAVLPGCAHAPKPTDAIETAVVVTEAALEVCKAKGGDTPSERASCLQVDDIERTRHATTALDDAVDALERWIADGK